MAQAPETVIRTLAAARAFIERKDQTDRAHSCCHGHYDCSDRDGGACLDETLSNFPELE
jgi:hypothetical protein